MTINYVKKVHLTGSSVATMTKRNMFFADLLALSFFQSHPLPVRQGLFFCPVFLSQVSKYMFNMFTMRKLVLNLCVLLISPDKRTSLTSDDLEGRSLLKSIVFSLYMYI